MAEAPWLTIIGLGEDGPDGLPSASRQALERAEVIMGPPRHLELLGATDAQTVPWPVPFADGIETLLNLRGQRTVVLASGDPFWFGAGAVLARHLAAEEWTALPGPSCFSLAAARLGWALERTTCLGLHAAPLGRLRPHLAPGAQLIVTLRDGAAVGDLAAYLASAGFGPSVLHVMEALGGPREHITHQAADDDASPAYAHPVCAAIEVQGPGPALPCVPGLPDELFAHDGQITKRPVRALTLSALAPVPGESLWDIGGGSGSIAIEWLRAHRDMRATSIEADAGRAARIAQNAAAMGVDHLNIVHGTAPGALEGLEPPNAVFVGGGLGPALLDRLTALPAGTRLIANAVTLEAEALLTQAQAAHGGDLLRIALSQDAPLGRKRGWRASYPIVQWSVTL
ncbi:MAG: precorrin-6y C5,15-methyltransferase (decarboxylating) subunit CbiE [Pseudomonadota bacterium]